MKQKKYICEYKDWRNLYVNSFFIVESDSLVHAISDARSHIRILNLQAGFKCCYLDRVYLYRHDPLK